MSRSFAVAALFGYSMIGVACENQRLSLRVHYPKISVYGQYANRLTLDDLRQIIAATLKQKEITLPIRSLSVDPPGHVSVLTTESEVPTHNIIFFHFEADKKKGIWIIDRKSLSREVGSTSRAKTLDRVTID